MNRLSKLLFSVVPSLTCSCALYKKRDRTSHLSCSLTPPELQKRKEIVIEALMEQVIKKKDLKNGYAFKFRGTDGVIDQLAEFIKTERECCDFFAFGLLISGDKSAIWLKVTGPKGAKDFIAQELQI